MTQIKEDYQQLDSLSFMERKEYEELKGFHSAQASQRRDRSIFIGFFVIGLIATLLISGALKFDHLRPFLGL